MQLLWLFFVGLLCQFFRFGHAGNQQSSATSAAASESLLRTNLQSVRDVSNPHQFQYTPLVRIRNYLFDEVTSGRLTHAILFSNWFGLGNQLNSVYGTMVANLWTKPLDKTLDTCMGFCFSASASFFDFFDFFFCVVSFFSFFATGALSAPTSLLVRFFCEIFSLGFSSGKYLLRREYPNPIIFVTSLGQVISQPWYLPSMIF